MLALKDKLAEKRRHKLEQQQRKHEIEAKKETLEQKKELAEVRTKHVSHYIGSQVASMYITTILDR